jgi:hypothetical protein
MRVSLLSTAGCKAFFDTTYYSSVELGKKATNLLCPTIVVAVMVSATAGKPEHPDCHAVGVSPGTKTGTKI